VSLALSRRLGLTTRAARIGAQVAVVAVVIGGTVAYAEAGKTVTLNVDGKAHQVSVKADTVGELLKDEGVKTASRDLVAPAPSAALKDGQTVVVRYARQLTVMVDGQQRTYWTTQTTVSGALSALGLRADDARLSVSRSAPIGRAGLTLSVTTPKTVTVKVDGTTRTVRTTSATVRELLTEAGVALGPIDNINVVPAAAVTDGLAVAVTRVSHRQVNVTESIPFPTKRVSSSALYKGDAKVTTNGRNGARAADYTFIYVDGKLAARRLVATTVTASPVTRVISIGTKAKPAPAKKATSSRSSFKGGSVSGASGLNWAALARCESGGNPRAVNPAGYYGLYQFSKSTWHSVGGSGTPSSASASEQTYRAQLLYKRTGASSWPVCGRKLFS